MHILMMLTVLTVDDGSGTVDEEASDNDIVGDGC